MNSTSSPTSPTLTNPNSSTTDLHFQASKLPSEYHLKLAKSMGLPEDWYKTPLFLDTPRKFHQSLLKVIKHLGLWEENGTEGVSLNNTVSGAFIWSLTPQGIDFWNSVNDYVKKGK